MQIIHDSVIKSSRMDNIDEICRYIARTIHSLNRKSFVVVSLYDPDINAVRIRAVRGFERIMDRITKLAGVDFTKLTFEPNKMEEVKSLSLTGKLEPVPGGLYTIMEQKIPRPVCRAAEKVMMIENVYSIGFALEDKAYGGITILPVAGASLKHVSVIEALASHFSLILHRRQSEQCLRESERLHKKAQKVAHIGHWELDSEGGTPVWSEEIFRIFGLDSSESEPSFTAHASHVHPEDWPLLNEAVTRGFRDGTAFDIEFRILQPGGEIKWLHALGTAEKDKEGKVVKLFGTAQDITKQKLAEQRIEHLESLIKAVRNVNQILVQEEDLQDMMEGACRALIEARTYSSCSIAIIDEDENKLQLLVQVGDRLFAKEWSVSPPGLENAPACIKQAFKSGKIVIMDTGECSGCKFKNNDSAYKSVVVPMKKGIKTIGLLHLCMSQSRDIGKEEKDLLEEVAADLAFGWEKHQTDKALKVTQLSVDMATTPIFWINPAGRFIYVNKAVCRHLGYTCEEILALGISDIDPNYPMMKRKEFWDDLRSIKKMTIATTHQRRDGTIIPVEVTTNYIEHNGDQYEFAFAMDITERKQAEEQIQRDLRIKETLLQEIHHRVKNNFTVISSLLNLQSNQVNSKEDAVKAFQESRNRIHSMLLVHENLYRARDFSHIDMKEYINILIKDLLPTYQQDKIIHTDLEITGVYLNINIAIPCGLILNEIITNALKHAFAGRREGRMVISFRLRKGGQYELIVRDDGIGLPQHINVHTANTLGLKLILLLTEQIDGTLEISRDGGTQFCIRFKKIK